MEYVFHWYWPRHGEAQVHLRPPSLHVHTDPLHAHMRMQGGEQTERGTHTVPTFCFIKAEAPFGEDDLGLPYRDRLSLATCRCYRLRSPVGSYQRSLRTQRACRSTRIKELASTTSLRQLTNRKNPFPPPFLTDAWLSQPLVSFSHPVRSCCSAAWLSDGIWWFRYIR